MRSQKVEKLAQTFSRRFRIERPLTAPGRNGHRSEHAKIARADASGPHQLRTNILSRKNRAYRRNIVSPRPNHTSPFPSTTRPPLLTRWPCSGIGCRTLVTYSSRGFDLQNCSALRQTERFSHASPRSDLNHLGQSRKFSSHLAIVVNSALSLPCGNTNPERERGLHVELV